MLVLPHPQGQSFKTFYKLLLPSELPENFLSQDTNWIILPTELDRNSGFIHLSTAIQTPKTAQRFFSNHSELWVIKIRFTDSSEDTRTFAWDPVGEEDWFPHIYKGTVIRQDVQDAIKIEKGQDGNWVFKEEWLEM